MFHIISDSACDLAEEYVKNNGVDIVSLYVTLDGETYYKDKTELSTRELYRLMVEENAYPKTSLPSVEDFMDACRPYLEAGEPVIIITISSFLSGSYNSARTAKEELLEEFPNAKIAVINSLQNTVEQALFVNEAVRMRDAGLSFEEAVEKLDGLRDQSRIFFTIGSLEYMKRGGRIGKLAVLAGDKLGIRPVIILKSGEVNVGGVARTRKKSMEMAFNCCKKFFQENHLNKEDYIFATGFGYDYEEGQKFRENFEKEFGVTCVDIAEQIGAVTVCHTGPYPIGIGVMRRYETL